MSEYLHEPHDPLPDCDCGECARVERNRLRERLARIRAVVDEQAEDEGLWVEYKHITEAYLQQELRRLHAVIEEDA